MFKVTNIRFFRILFLAVFCLGVASLGTRLIVELRHSQQKGRFVVSMVQEQVNALSESSSRLWGAPAVWAPKSGWPDDFLALQNWIIQGAILGKDPDSLSHQLAQISHGRTISPTLSASIRRWQDGLVRWSRARAKFKGSDIDPQDLLEEGRLRHHEAVGYDKIGRGYDATVLYLWSADFLRRFIAQAPLEAEVPEALYLLGQAHVRFRHAFPPSIRSDRFLNLCSELFPGTLWAKRANAVWRDEMRNEI
jgi:hypothetical protein